LPLLRVDAVLIAQLLENLLDNALRYAPEGPVELRAHTSPQGQIVLAVRDRGPGVPPAWRERIFERFEQVTGADADSAAASRRGTGLGLALCRAIARAHGGELRLRLRSHGGSSFECHLPASAQPEGPSMTQEE
jgi:two-component system sensor histidine kinase KdpD